MTEVALRRTCDCKHITNYKLLCALCIHKKRLQWVVYAGFLPVWPVPNATAIAMQHVLPILVLIKCNSNNKNRKIQIIQTDHVPHNSKCAIVFALICGQPVYVRGQRAHTHTPHKKCRTVDCNWPPVIACTQFACVFEMGIVALPRFCLSLSDGFCTLQPQFEALSSQIVMLKPLKLR